jgi:two-component system chemotaxis sensor kinase CheA
MPATPAAPAAGPSRPTAAAQPAESRQSIRVDLERVDRLINLVGELVISEAMLSQSLSQSGAAQHPAVVTSLGQLKQLSTELQERIMAIRAQSVKPLFQRMSRIVREAAAASGCEVRLVTEGEATEVDKTVIERLADPLTHMLRNAVDHGIEDPEHRETAGKPRQGTVLLSAAHRSGQVIIEITDDGAGIDTERVLAKAVEKGLVPVDAELSEQEIYNLLFEPGFSTAARVSDLSGRGVGMDVVRSEIRALGGRVTLSSLRGRGTTATISLPLTLAVVEGMLIEVAGETLVVPSTALRETMRGSDAAIHQMGADGPILAMRGELIQLVDLGLTLGYRSASTDISARSLLLVESSAGRRAALVVDRIVGQREVVIKGLSENYGHVPGIAAATILGDGSIALIVDVDQVAAREPGLRDTESLLSAVGAR